MSGHGIDMCECGAVVAQCRCPATHVPVIVCKTCSKCRDADKADRERHRCPDCGFLETEKARADKAEAENRALLALVAEMGAAYQAEHDACEAYEEAPDQATGQAMQDAVVRVIQLRRSDPIAAGLAILTAVEDRLIERVVACIEAGPLAPAPNYWWGSRVASAVYGVDETARGQAGEAVREAAAKRLEAQVDVMARARQAASGVTAPSRGQPWQSLVPLGPDGHVPSALLHAAADIRSLDIATIVTTRKEG